MHEPRHDEPAARFGVRELVAYATLLVLLQCGLAFTAAACRWHSEGMDPLIVLTLVGTMCIAVCQLLAALRNSYLLSCILALGFTTIGVCGFFLWAVLRVFVLGIGVGDDVDDPGVLFHVIAFSLPASWVFIGATMAAHACFDPHQDSQP